MWRGALHEATEDAPFGLEYRIVHADGSVRWVWERGIAVRDAADRVVALEGIVEDVTARTENELALREAERRYRGIFDNAIEGMFSSAPSNAAEIVPE